MVLLAFLIGVVAGLRSFTAPAVLAWAARLNWLNLSESPVAFMASTAAVVVFSLMAAAELVVDKLPSTPSRTRPLGLGARIMFGALSGACVAVAAAQSLAIGAALGVAGGLAGAFGGYQARTRLARAFDHRDFVIAVLEDAVAIGSALAIVSRF